MTRSSRRWLRVGSVGVDSGMIMLGDPCYVAADSHPDHPVHDWGRFLDELRRQGGEDWQTAEMEGAVVVSSGYGDGEYPVEVRMEGGRVAAVRVTFIPEGDR